MLPSERVDNPNPDDVKKEKQKIVNLIVSKSNLDIYNSPEAWSLFKELGGDVMINAFACNFMVDGVPNTDVIEANQLNTRIFNKTSLSSTNGGGEIDMPEFFLTSSVLSQADYGACLDKFKSRMGLSGPQDLYVLVNVTMSPWATTGAQSILNDMVGDFKTIAEKETSIDRNAVKPQKHDFVMQGTDTLYLVHLPKFQLASHRYQLVMTGTLDSSAMQQYAAQRKENPNDYFLLENATDAILDDLTASGSQIAISVFKESDTTQKPVIQGTLTIGDLIVKKSLLGGALDPTFPSQMPFHLYAELSTIKPICNQAKCGPCSLALSISHGPIRETCHPSI
ncbi:uncharacterized protein ALTATR162_LOCUS5007 [Alternaria atra]|uniref:Uncharacterized protein n=1 Tax=Alternaria atra TaxID=119953 RepID=A0A8J2I627_9PLEO|nr:uncharacterized protein ALTATR162_LOCUS5007 [Alternaria atra]CAG5158148.1 unnamed protein product [Alternaria atra]